MNTAPQNPKKPRLSRRIISQFTLTLSVLLALSFVMLATVGPSTQEADALEWSDIVIIGSSAGAGAAIGAAVGDGIGAVIGAAGGAVIGGLLVWMNEEKTDAALGSNAKDSYSSALKNISADYLGLAGAQIDNLNALWETSQYYLIRKAEYAALDLYNYQISNELTTSYDSYYVLSRSEVANATLSYSWAMNQQLSAVLNAHSDLAFSFVGTYDGMTWGFEGSTNKGGAISSMASKATRQTIFTTSTYTSNEYGKTYTTASANSDIYLVNVADSPVSNWPVEISLRNGTKIFNQNINMAAHEVRTFNLSQMGYPSGDYHFSISDPSNFAISNLRWFGNFGTSITNSAYVYPAILSFYKSGENATLDFASIDHSASNNGAYSYVTGQMNFNTLAVTSSPYLFFSDGTGAMNYDRISLFPYMEKVEQIILKTDDMQVTANSFAQSYYNFLVANGPDAPRVMPDIIFPDPSQLEGMSWQQIYAIFLAYMTQMESWFEDNSIQGMDSVNITAESLKLLCRGAIYNATGAMLFNETAIWTPYISLDDMMLYAGQNNTMEQPGFVIVWGYSENLANFTRPSTAVYVPTIDGYNLFIEEMTYDGNQVTEQELTVTTIEWVIYQPTGNITPPQGLSDLDWLLSRWYYFAIIAGIICLLAAISLRNTAVILVGVVLLAAGGIGYYMAGDFSLLDGLGLNMEPSNLRAWLQHLR